MGVSAIWFSAGETSWLAKATNPEHCPRKLRLAWVVIYADVAFALEVQENLLRCFLGREIRGVNHDIRIGGGFVGIGDAGELLEHAGTSLCVKAFAVALL